MKVATALPLVDNIWQNREASQQGVAVWAENISAEYNGKMALVDVNMQLASGSLIAILGPNGAGKTTLFKLLTGLKKPLSGEIEVLGQPVDNQRKSNEIAYVPQHEEIDWDYPISVWEVVTTGRYGHMRLAGGIQRFFPFGWANQKERDEVKKALDAVGIDAYQKPIGALSGGQKKRVFLARALAQKPKLYLLDEPFAGVDRNSEEYILQVLNKARADGNTLIMITHDWSSVHHYADWVVLMNQTVVAQGRPDDVMTEENMRQTFSA